MIDIEVKYMSKLSELAKAMSVPIRDIALGLATAIRLRVQRRGENSTGGKFSELGTYTTTGRSRDQNAQWWVAPEDFQPSGMLFEVKEGEFNGWAVYENFQHYFSLLPASKKQRRWNRSGQMWASYKVRVMARNKAIIGFYGNRPTSRNAKTRIRHAQVAFLAGRKEPTLVLQYSADESAAVLNTVRENLESNWGKVLQAGVVSKVKGRLGNVNGVALVRRPTV